MSFLSRDNSIANRFPYPALLQEVVVSTDFCGDIPNPVGPDFRIDGFEVRTIGTATVVGPSPAEPEHPGIATCNVAAAVDVALVTLNRFTFDASDSAVRIGTVIRFNALTDDNTIAGVGSTIGTLGAGVPRVQLLAQVGTGFFVAETTGLNPQITVTPVPVALGRWYRLEIVSLGTTNAFYIDGALVATHSAVNTTVDAASAGLIAPVGVGTPGNVDLDLLYAVQSGLNR